MPGSTPDLTGHSVIVLHRMAKNSISEIFKTRGYAMLTQQCFENTGKPDYAVKHEESYDDIGTLNCAVINLTENFLKKQQEERNYISPQESDSIQEAVFKTTPEILWNYCIDPVLRKKWQGNTFSVRNKRNAENKFGTGSETHCIHGGYQRISKIIDFRPYDYFTAESRHRPAFLFPPLRGIFEFTSLSPTETKFSFRVRVLRRDPFTLFAAKYVAPWFIRMEMNFDRLRKVVESSDEVASESEERNKFLIAN
jgi:hypothetical protein